MTTTALAEHTENTPENEIETPPEALQYYTDYAKLTLNQRRVLLGLLENSMSKKKQTDEQIANSLGLTRMSIWNCRQHPVFQRLLGIMSLDLMRGHADVLIGFLMTQAETRGSSLSIALEMSGLYTKRLQQEILTANIGDIERAKTPDAAISGIVTQLGQLNMTKDRIIDLVSTTYDRLKAEGAF